MSSVQNLWRQLVQRRLWPVAVLLLAGLAVVPVMLAKDPESVAATPPAPAKTGDNELAEQPIVTPAADTRGRRIVIGKRKNPFAMPKPDDPTETTDQPSASIVRTAGGGDSAKPSSSGGGGGGSTPSSTGSTPAPAPAPAPVDPVPAPQPKSYAVHELTVRFGTSDDLSRRTLKRLQPLPSAAQPVLIYMGVLKDGKTAVFLVDHGVEPVGDGECMPRPDDCETIRLRTGETEFLDVKDEAGAVTDQYQLDLLKIHRGTTASAAKANASSRSGARIVRARAAHDGPAGYRFDAARGTVERRGHALRSSVAHLSSGLG